MLSIAAYHVDFVVYCGYFVLTVCNWHSACIYTSAGREPATERRNEMYKITWKHLLAEFIGLAAGIAMGCATMMAGWYILGLRDGAMAGWALLSVATGCAPIFWAAAYQIRTREYI